MRRDTVKTALPLDVGGPMDGRVKVCKELFSAARMGFKRPDHVCFHTLRPPTPVEPAWPSA